VTASSNLRATAIAIRAVPISGMIAAAKAVKRVADAEGRAAGGPLVGKKRRGLKLRARDTIRTAGDTTTCRIQGVSPAGWVWVNTGTAPHAIRRRKRGPMRKMTVRHPGTAGRGGWRKVVARAEQIVPAIFETAVSEAVR
jgi:hypothetical protein